MNYEKLTKCQKMWEDISEIQKFIDVLQNPYCNNILGWDYSKKDSGERVSMDLDGELRQIVISYLQNKLNSLQNEFEKI